MGASEGANVPSTVGDDDGRWEGIVEMLGGDVGAILVDGTSVGVLEGSEDGIADMVGGADGSTETVGALDAVGS